VAYPAAKQKAEAAAAASRVGYEEWKKAHSLEVYTKTGAIVMESGMGLGRTVVVLNQWRRRRTLEPISYGCLQRFVDSSAIMVLEKWETIKPGSKDEGAMWAWARRRPRRCGTSWRRPRRS
jgi:hypothetical protein